jgi:translation initiation factor 6
LYGRSSDKICILGNILEKKREIIEDVLKVKSVALTLSNTDFVGIFCALNDNGILLPKIITDSEKEKFSELKKLFGININVLNSKFTALGNLILCNENGALISKLFSIKDRRVIEDCLGIESSFSTIGGIQTVGSCGIATNRGCLLHRDASEDEIKLAEEVLKVKVDIGTANFGSPFVGSCAIANSNGAIIGESTTGPEITRLEEALGFL